MSISKGIDEPMSPARHFDRSGEIPPINAACRNDTSVPHPTVISTEVEKSHPSMLHAAMTQVPPPYCHFDRNEVEWRNLTYQWYYPQ